MRFLRLYESTVIVCHHAAPDFAAHFLNSKRFRNDLRAVLYCAAFRVYFVEILARRP